MTATERLRAMLDERGVEWTAGEDECDRKTHWKSGGLTWEYFNDDNGDAWLGFLGACEQDISPEQAVAATLGRSAEDDGYLGELSRMRLEVELLRSENDKLRERVRDMRHFLMRLGVDYGKE